MMKSRLREQLIHLTTTEYRPTTWIKQQMFHFLILIIWIGPLFPVSGYASTEGSLKQSFEFYSITQKEHLPFSSDLSAYPLQQGVPFSPADQLQLRRSQKDTVKQSPPSTLVPSDSVSHDLDLIFRSNIGEETPFWLEHNRYDLISGSSAVQLGLNYKGVY